MDLKWSRSETFVAFLPIRGAIALADLFFFLLLLWREGSSARGALCWKVSELVNLQLNFHCFDIIVLGLAPRKSCFKIGHHQLNRGTFPNLNF